MARLAGKFLLIVLLYMTAGPCTLYGQIPLRSLEDLDRKEIGIGVLIATWQENYARERFPNARIIPLNNTTDLLSLLRNGDCDVVFLAYPACVYILEEAPDMAFLDQQVAATSVSVGFRLNDTTLLPKFNAFLSQIRENGILEQMEERWLEKTGGSMPAFPESLESQEILRIGTTCMDVPFTFYQNNRPAGFDIEMTRRFAAWLGKKPVFVISDFSGMLAGMSAGKMDMMANYIMVTEERSAKYSFSDTYLTTYSSMLTLRNRLEHGSVIGKKSQDLTERFYNNLILDKRYLLLWDGLKATLLVAFLSILGGTLMGAIICFLRMSRMKIARIAASGYISFFRGIPQVVLLMLMFYVFFASTSMNGVTVSVITFSLIFGAYVSEMFRSAIQSVPTGQTEAGIALGFSRAGAFIQIVLPQAIKQVYPVYKGELIALTKLTSIVGYIAVQDLTKASDLIRSRTFDAFFPLIVISVIYFFLSWGLARLLDIALPTNIRHA
ncbi:MAG: ABC transporter substrate-binding protein/permease [Bacteroidales bacterium]|jgi:polar amino acid transport system substrate-binding protein|nr:ABC transporter substrate-binding protein/permease [Bacteroidales bacterium]MDD3100012.1 ABC transporter substrate-binding protein/permease [Bacteroidales bacterium]MDD3638708.1 ABC transporter substrate-binding protein/permease [Bacteroidales bacterium]MDD3943513.1 ABC transporter substrate-binding protein/permease [Bacteroidales bacterium]MDD4480005.1 ABC transporter substrate-binding protein/permease [Bacteroidales bacterium]